MALTSAEKELLAVVRYYNENKRPVAKLVTKLMRDFDLPDVKALTGLNGDEIHTMCELAKPKPYKKKAAAKSNTETVEAPKPVEFDESTLPGRVAKEIYQKHINVALRDSKLPSQKQLMGEMQCGVSTVTAANKLLIEAGLIEAIDGNARNGYAVK